MIGGNRMSDKGQKLVVGHFGVSDEIELFIEVGYDDAKRRKSPVSRMPDGRVVIFRREHHNYMKPGETWLCIIDEDRSNMVVATPHRRLSASPITQENDRRKAEKMPPEVATVIVNTLEDRIHHLQQKMDNTNAQILPLEEKESALANELQAVKNALATLKDEKTRAASDLEMFSKSIDTFKGMEVPDDISIEEIEQNAGVYGIPDYWGQMTEESKKDNGNDDRQIGKSRQEYQE